MKENFFGSKLESVLPWLVLLVLLAYTFAGLFVNPYIGFQFISSTGEVNDVYSEGPDLEYLQLGDRILSIGELSWNEYTSDLRKPPIQSYESNSSVEIQVRRIDQKLTVQWLLPGFTVIEFLNRLIDIWPLGYLFWLVGTLTILLVRPKNQRRNLLAAFFYVTALWLVTGTFSGTHVWASALLMRAAIWLSLPIYLQLHWNFPRQLSPLSGSIWKTIYGIALVGAVLQWFQILPNQTYIWPFLLALLGSGLLLAIHYVLRPGERRDIGLLFLAVGIAFAPALATAVASAQDSIDPILPGLLFSMSALPGAYFYVLYRRQLGGLQLRANRLISLYLYLVILLTFLFLVLPLLPGQLLSPQSATGLIAIFVLPTALLSVVGFNRFQRFVERRILNVPIAPEDLVVNFARKIATSITPEHLTAVLREEVLPSLLIRQSALVQLGNESNFEILFAEDLAPSQLPSEQDLRELLNQSDEAFKPRDESEEISEGRNWVELALPLLVGDKTTGIWLLGRRDPDDHYSYSATVILASLADQMAIALTNIAQAKQLRALYQMDIERQEIERTHLARELHDDVLNRFAELKLQLGEQEMTKEFEQNYQHLVDYLRATIHGLRPPMLNYGLHAGLTQLADDLGERSNTINIKLAIPSSPHRVDPKVEQHLYRIVQQALENAFHHAQAQNIEISGEISEEHIHLIVSDDGQGFDLQGGLDLVKLLAGRHFGLASMSERAALLGARLEIETHPGKGTKIEAHWLSKEI